MESRVAVVAGSTGLIGSLLIKKLLDEPRYDKVIALTRRPLGLHHIKLQEMNVDFRTLCHQPLDFSVNDAYCCLGTTMKKAGSKDAFFEVDFTFALRFAEWALENKASQLLLVSSLGANPNSLFYYNRVKGDLEAAIEQLRYRSLHIFRPSLLLGSRDDSRLGEGLGQAFAKIFNPLIPDNYKGIPAEDVAEAMLRMALDHNHRGVYLHESEQIHQMSACRGVSA